MLFNSSKLNKPSAASFKKKADEILGVFTKTKQDLVDLNVEKTAYLQEIDNQLSELDSEKKQVTNALSQSENIIKKIDALLS